MVRKINHQNKNKEKNYIIYNLSEQSENEVMKDIIERWNKF